METEVPNETMDVINFELNQGEFWVGPALA